MNPPRFLLSVVSAAMIPWTSHAVTTAGPLVPTTGAHVAATTPADVAADMDFLLRAWRGNVEELAAARLALKRSRDTRVREFARDLVRDHSAANLEFQRLAALRGLGVPKSVHGRDATRDFRLQGLRGAAFDRQFVNAVGIQAHRDAIELFRQEAQHGRDQAMARFASDRLPLLRKHLARAEALQSQFELARRNFSPSR